MARKWYNLYGGSSVGTLRNIYGLYRDAWTSSKRGKKNGNWNDYYTAANAIPIVRGIADSFNSYLEQNKVKANTGADVSDYNNPSTSFAADAGNTASGLPYQMVGLTSMLDRVYGNPENVDRTVRQPHSPRTGWRPRHYSGKRNYRRFRQ